MTDLSSFPITRKWPARHPGHPRSQQPRWQAAGDDYTIADIATFPWVRNLLRFYEAGELVGISDFPHVTRALAAFVARPAITRGIEIPKRA